VPRPAAMLPVPRAWEPAVPPSSGGTSVPRQEYSREEAGQGAAVRPKPEARMSAFPACPACGASAAAKRLRGLGEGQLWECGTCGLTFYLPIPEPKAESCGPKAVCTEEGYTQNTLAGADATKVARFAANRHKAYQGLLGKSNYRMLEIGCGVADLGLAL